MLSASALLLLPATARCAADEPVKADVTVAADGSGQYKTVTAAINASPIIADPRSGKTWTIFVKAGTYRELLYIQREKRFTRIVGEDAARTIITFDLSANMPNADGAKIGTFRTPTVVVDADDFTFENITLQNSAGRVGQALAVRIDGDRVVFRNCRFLGYQDTILANRGRHYFHNCYISGATDFIFGGATAWFENCHIHCIGDGYITAASTPFEQPFGFVFNNCRITAENPEIKTFLGRPWRDFASVTFLNTDMSEAVRPQGWHNWGRPQREQTARFAEYNSSGPGGSSAGRVAWARQLSDDEAKQITIQRVLGGADGWDPTSTP
jgi:pectinesterase